MKQVYLVEGSEIGAFAGIVQELMGAAKFPAPLLYDFRYVIEKVFRGEWQLWVMFESGEVPELMMVTWAAQMPFGKLCFIELVCGEGLAELLSLNQVFDNWLKFQNIDLVQSTTRPEIARMLTKAGWQTGNQLVYRWRERVQ